MKMYEKLNGSEIVASLAGDRPYWQLGAADVGRWVGSLPPSATQDNVSRVEWVGEAWDGISDVFVGEPSWGRNLKAGDLIKLLGKLRSGMRTLGIERIAPPEPSDVRIFRTAATAVLIIDIDFVDFILPLAIDGVRSMGKRPPSTATVAAEMLKFVKGADAMRVGVVRREEGMRRALEETAAAIGHGAAPLWLRLRHVPHYDDPEHLLEADYVVLFATLNEKLVWAPTGSERIHTVQEVRDHQSYYCPTHGERAAMLEELLARNSAGRISQTALALIVDKGLDAGETLKEAISAGMADRHGAMHFERGKTKESLYVQDGVLLLSLSFPGGHYFQNRLTVSGDYPPSVVSQAKHKLFCDFVDHPALAGRDLKVTDVLEHERSLEIHHAARSFPVEQSSREAEGHSTAD